jgi:protein-disulfide isomerase
MQMRPVSESDHVQGYPHAPLTIVEYGDFECPYCGEAYEVIKQLKAEFRGEIRFVFRNFPLRKIHPNAELAAEAAEAAGAQGKFWEMYALLYENQEALELPDLVHRAESLGLDLKRFQEDLLERVYSKKVSTDFQEGVKSGVNSTPSFFVNGAYYRDSWDFETFSNALRRLLDRELIRRAI